MSTANKRATNVQVPGEEKKPEAEQPKETQGGQGAEGSETAEGTGAGQTEGSTAAPAINMDALREQIRAEEAAKLRAELSEQIEAAKGDIKVAETIAAKPSAKPGRRDYLQMRAEDIDPASLTAPVRTKDGWLCPPAPEAKK